ncbi:MAG: cytochrome C [Cytophagales bacterium]|nr:MAG: cytochrome C [Cytophagales bacterium]
MKVKIYAVLLLLFVGMQFLQPTRNKSVSSLNTSIEKHFEVPIDVQNSLSKACYDCHSDNTQYPWYAGLQPLAWYLDHHINEGKKELNFSVFSTYPPQKAAHKLEEIGEVLTLNEMPLQSYTMLHPLADLSNEEKTKLITWATELRKLIVAKHKL